MDKLAAIQGMIRGDGLGLEIGASYSPLLSKAAGHRIRTLDHATRDELVTKYRALGLPQHQIDAIEDVDYVWRGERLVDLVGPDTRFDYVIASHVIEHTTDLVGFINGCAEILQPDGVLCLVVPDKRFCFDRFRPHTSLGQVVEAHLNPSHVHPVAPFVDTHAYAAHRFGVEPTWSSETTDSPRLVGKDWQEVHHTIAGLRDAQAYRDIHRWTFTPASFTLLLDDLVQLGYLTLGVASISDTNAFEFYVGLDSASTAEAASQPDDDRRLGLLLDIENQLVEQAGLGGTQECVAQQLAAAKAELAAVYSSRSWRATSPVRRMTLKLKASR